jgi:hypothetical protein
VDTASNRATAPAVDDKELVTHSRMVAFRACRRRHHYAYELGARPLKQSKPLLVGDALHKWLERWFINGAAWLPPVAPIFGVGPDLDAEREWRGDPMRGVESAFDAVAADDPYEVAKLRAMVLAYHLRWRTQEWRALVVEAEFRAPLTNPLTNRTSRSYERGGKIDAIVELDASLGPEWEGQWIVEHKSNRGPLDPESTYWQRLRLDPQCSDYWLGAHALGFQPRGIIYDVVCKPTIEPYKATPLEKRKMTQGTGCKICGGSKGKQGSGRVPKAGTDGTTPCAVCKESGWKIGEEPRWYADVRLEDETPGAYGLRCFETILAEPDRYLHRHRVVRLEQEMHEHLIDGWFTVRALHEQRATGIAPRNPDACFLYGRPCDYYAVCCGSASIDDQRLFRTGRRHPELRVVNDG